MRNWVRRFFSAANPRPTPAPPLALTEISSYAEYQKYRQAREAVSHANWLLERSLIPQSPGSSHLDGYCFVCKRQVPFLVDFLYSSEEDGVPTPNWRERLVCPHCQLNNRMRAVVQIFAQVCSPAATASIYLTEQTTPLYRRLKHDFAALRGSEFLGASSARGAADKRGIRNEDLTQLSFADASQDYILSFDVFEHVPAYKAAFAECWRCLKPGGQLVFSVPFIRDAERNLVRATLSASGEITHLLPPEYHGDPISDAGCLCFYHFGWEMLDELLEVGFVKSCALLYWSRELGYLGGEQLLFVATKAAEEAAGP